MPGIDCACMELVGLSMAPEPTISENPFTDVQTTDYYYKAVLWAAEQGITSGTTPTTFSPEKICRNF